MGRDFDRMAARLEAGLEAERRLLGDISHELRSFLARLSVALDLVEQNRAVPEEIYRNVITHIRRESGRLNEMIGQLLELSRLELHHDNGEAILTVRDFGAGVPQAALENLFRPFILLIQAATSKAAAVWAWRLRSAPSIYGASVETRNAQGGGLEVEMRFPLAQTNSLQP